MRRSFHDELNDLHDAVFKMGCLVEEAVKDAVVAIGDSSPDLVEKVVQGDDKVDKIFDEIETDCFMMLATQQPVARDLRLIACSIRVISELERMGDLAINIVKYSPGANNGEPLAASGTLIGMGTAVSAMIAETLKGFINWESDIAERIEERDETVDIMYMKLFEQLFECGGEYDLRSAIKSAFVGRYLERIADHCVTIAERVNFLVEGKVEQI